MREIKFKAWVDSPDIRVSQDGKLGAFMTDEIDDISFKTNTLYFKSGLSVKLSDVTLLQFTGLKDKNGKEIYEGDCFKCHEHSAYGWSDKWDYYVIGEDNLYGRIDKKLIFSISFNETCNLDDPDFRKDIEVIGNLYENPELLKKED